MSDEFASKLIALRVERDLTQQQLADAVGISSSQISRYESGSATPRKTVMLKLARALRVEVADLAGEATRSPKTISSVPSDLDEEEETNDPKSRTLPFDFTDAQMNKLKALSDESGKSIQDVIRDLLTEGLTRMGNDPEFRAGILRDLEDDMKKKKSDPLP